MSYYYYVNSWEKAEPDGGEYLFSIEHRKIDDIDEWEWESLLEDCADDYLHNHDGWEHSNWAMDPIEFWIYDEDKKFIDKFLVYLEYRPSFSAVRVNE